jgi:hypothetical protein
MKRAFLALPGPVPVKAVLAALLVVAAVIALLLVYDWMGKTLLDSGGGIG